MRITRIPGIASVFALFAVALLASPALAQRDDTSSLEGKPAPAFSLQTVQGKDMSLAKEKGNVVVLDFWATWCPPCREALPHINALHEDKARAEKGLKVFAINLQEDKAKAKAYIEQNNMTFPVPLDLKGATAQKYKVQGIPTTVVIGRDGKIAKVFVGSGQDKQLDAAIDEALAVEKPAASAGR